jgi:hypothetical protein
LKTVFQLIIILMRNLVLPYENAVTKIGSKEYENKKINKLKTLPRGFKEIKGYN